MSSREYVVRVGGKEYTVKVTEISPGKFKVIVDGHELEVEAPAVTVGVTPTPTPPMPATKSVETPKPERRAEEKPKEVVTPQPQLATKPEAPTTPPSAGIAVEAPVPGKVLKVLVQPGQKVSKSTVLLTLESMKMELEVYPPGEGVVKEIRVKPGDFVNAGDVLAILE